MEKEKSLNCVRACKCAETLAREAGAKCLELQSGLGEVHYKTAKDVVTIADVTSEKIIVEGLKKEFPEIPVRTEEGGRIAGDSSRYEWIIDPVDGTVNFSRGIPLWGISIALMECGKPAACVVFLPALRAHRTAQRGGSGIDVVASTFGGVRRCIARAAATTGMRSSDAASPRGTPVGSGGR